MAFIERFKPTLRYHANFLLYPIEVVERLTGSWPDRAVEASPLLSAAVSWWHAKASEIWKPWRDFFLEIAIIVIILAAFYTVTGSESLVFLGSFYLMARIVAFLFRILFLHWLMGRGAEDDENELIYALSMLSLDLRSGLSLLQGMERVAFGRHGKVSRSFLRVIRRLEVGTHPETALIEEGRAVQSEHLRRMFRHLAVATRSGADMAVTVETLREDLVNDHKIRLREYSHILRFLVMMFTIVGAIIPVLSVVTLITVSGLPSVNVSEILFWCIFAFIVVTEYTIVYLSARARPVTGIRNVEDRVAVRESGFINSLSRFIKVNDPEDDVQSWVRRGALYGFIIAIPVAIYALATRSLRYFPLTGSVLLVSVLVVLFMLGRYYLLKLIVGWQVLELERYVPEVLEVMSSHIRSGSSLITALRAAAHEDFGPLKDDLSLITNRSFGSTSTEAALAELGDKYPSPILQKMTGLLEHGFRSGANIADALSRFSREIVRFDELEREIVTETRFYQYVVLFMIIFVAPTMLASATYIVSAMSKVAMLGDVPEEVTSSMPIAPMGHITIGENFVVMFSVLLLTVTSTFSSLLIGVIRTGRQSHGFRYIPLLMFAALIMFFWGRYFMFGSFGDMLL